MLDYEMLEKDIILADQQIDELSNSATPPEIFFSYQEKEWRAISLKLVEHKVEVYAVEKEFDFGDGYYEMNAPEEENTITLLLSIEDKTVRELVDKINSEWQDSEITVGALQVSSILYEYIEATQRRGNIEEVKNVIGKKVNEYKIYNAFDEQVKKIYVNAIKNLESYIQLIHSSKEEIEKKLQEKLNRRQKQKERDKKAEIVINEMKAYYQEHPFTKEELLNVDLLYAHEKERGYTYEYKKDENGNIILNKQLLIRDDGTKSNMWRDPEDILLWRHILKRLKEEGL